MLLSCVMCLVAAESMNHSCDRFVVLEISATPSSSAILDPSLVVKDTLLQESTTTQIRIAVFI